MTQRFPGTGRWPTGAAHAWGGAAVSATLLLVLGGSPALRAQTSAELQGYQQRLQHLFQRLDRNADHRLDRQEVQGHPYLERHFERLDRQGRGYLTPEDLNTTPAQRGERAQRFLEQADRNGDGRIDRREAEPYPWLKSQFNQADRNGDGRVERSELRGLADQRRRQPPQP